MSSSKMLSFGFVSFSIIQRWILTPLSATNSLRYTYAYVIQHQNSISSFLSIIPFYSFLGVFVPVLFFLPRFDKSCRFCSPSLELTFACYVIRACSLLLTRLYTFISLPCLLFQNASYQVLAVTCCSPIVFTQTCLKF